MRGFGFGAADYMTKPFHKDELVARIHAIVRRSKVRRGFPLTHAEEAAQEPVGVRAKAEPQRGESFQP